jgi:hypothetical protein
MQGTIADYAGLVANLDLHHVGILCYAPPPLTDWDGIMFVSEFRCTCWLKGQVEFVVPHEGCNLYNRLKESGNRLHHIAFQVADLKKEAEVLAKQGFITFTKEPVKGVGNTLVHFLLPENRGVLVELVQCPK